MLEQVQVRRSEVCQKLLKFKSDESVQQEQITQEQKKLEEADRRVEKLSLAMTECDGEITRYDQEVRRLTRNLNEKQQEYHTAYTKLESLRNLACLLYTSGSSFGSFHPSWNPAGTEYVYQAGRYCIFHHFRMSGSQYFPVSDRTGAYQSRCKDHPGALYLSGSRDHHLLLRRCFCGYRKHEGAGADVYKRQVQRVYKTALEAGMGKDDWRSTIKVVRGH